MSVIIDVPEPVGFEVSFPVLIGDAIVDYPHAGTVFTPQVVADFTRTLRRIRLILDPSVMTDCPHPVRLLEEAIVAP